MIEIKDGNFLEFLRTKKFKSCLYNQTGKPDINGCFLNPESDAVLNKTSVSIRPQSGSFYIEDICGIEYFINLDSLTAAKLDLKKLSSLPPKLTHLNIAMNELHDLPPLPKTLKVLNLSYNSSICIKEIPEGLEILHCIGCDLTHLPQLPSTLKELHCSYNKLTELPDLPNGLLKIFCSENKIKKLKALPSSLEILDIEHNQLEEIPAYSAKTDVYFSGNPVTKKKKMKKQSYFYGNKESDNIFLKFVIVEELMSVDKNLKKQLKDISHNQGSAALYSFIEELQITEKQLLTIEEITFDGGLEIYSLLTPDWDGEDSSYDIRSLDGIGELQNLRTITCISMVDEIDTWSPALELQKLKKISGADLDIEDELEEKGVQIE